MRHIRVIALAMVASGIVAVDGRPAQAAPAGTEIVTDISEHLISITSNFSGTSLLLFGAIASGGGDVVVTVRGPSSTVMMRRKDRVAGIWINRIAERFHNVPGYFAVAATRPLAHIAPPVTLKRFKLDAGEMEFLPENALSKQEHAIFNDAIIRAKRRQNLYPKERVPVSVLGGTLFRTKIEFPANVPVGTYQVQIYLVRDGHVVSAQSLPLFVKKHGMERAIFDFAHEQPLIYGIAAVALALAAGWGAGMVFRSR